MRHDESRVRSSCELRKKKEWVGPRYKRPTYLWFRPLLAPHSKLLPFRPSPSLSGAFSFYTTSASAPVVMVFFYSSSSSPVPRHHVFLRMMQKKKSCVVLSRIVAFPLLAQSRTKRGAWEYSKASFALGYRSFHFRPSSSIVVVQRGEIGLSRVRNESE